MLDRSRIPQKRFQNHTGLDGPDDRPVLWAYGIELVGQNIAARPGEIDNDDRRISGNVSAHEARYEARIGVISASRRRADLKRDLLALVKIGDGVLSEGTCTGAKANCQGKYGKCTLLRQLQRHAFPPRDLDREASI